MLSLLEYLAITAQKIIDKEMKFQNIDQQKIYQYQQIRQEYISFMHITLRMVVEQAQEIAADPGEYSLLRYVAKQNVRLCYQYNDIASTSMDILVNHLLATGYDENNLDAFGVFTQIINGLIVMATVGHSENYTSESFIACEALETIANQITDGNNYNKSLILVVAAFKAIIKAIPVKYLSRFNVIKNTEDLLVKITQQHQNVAGLDQIVGLTQAIINGKKQELLHQKQDQEQDQEQEQEQEQEQLQP